MQSTTPDLGNSLISMVMSQGTPRENKQANKTQATLIHPTAASQHKWGKPAVPALASLDPIGLSALHCPAPWKRSTVETKSSQINSNEHWSKDEQETPWSQDKPLCSFSNQGQTPTQSLSEMLSPPSTHSLAQFGPSPLFLCIALPHSSVISVSGHHQHSSSAVDPCPPFFPIRTVFLEQLQTRALQWSLW